MCHHLILLLKNPQPGLPGRSSRTRGAMSCDTAPAVPSQPSPRPIPGHSAWGLGGVDSSMRFNPRPVRGLTSDIGDISLWLSRVQGGLWTFVSWGIGCKGVKMFIDVSCWDLMFLPWFWCVYSRRVLGTYKHPHFPRVSYSSPCIQWLNMTSLDRIALTKRHKGGVARCCCIWLRWSDLRSPNWRFCRWILQPSPLGIWAVVG